MDLIRASIKCLFYDYPLPKVLEFINAEGDDRLDDFLSYFPYIVQYRERNYTLTEVQTLQSMLRDVWLKDVGGMLLTKPFYILPIFASEVLSDNNGTLKVIFENYLRWHDLSLYVGEDFLTTAFFASKDADSGSVRTSFSWPAVLEHDKEALNNIINKGCSDVHNHLYASADVFNINWITLMNQVQESVDRKKDADDVDDADGFEYIDIVDFESPLKDPVPNYWGYQDYLTLKRLAVLASLIRLLLYKTLCKQQIPDEQWDVLNKILDNNYEQADCIPEVQNWIGKASYTKRTFYKCKDWDYVINDDTSIDIEDTPYAILAGERWLLYNFMRCLFEKSQDIEKIAPYVYVYSLIKLIYRRELVLTNNLKGYRNFRRYQSMEQLFIHAQKDRKTLAACYALATGIRLIDKDFFETRVSMNKQLLGLQESINAYQDFDKGIKVLNEKLLERITFVGSASKALTKPSKSKTHQKNEDSRRYKNARRSAKSTADAIKEAIIGTHSEYRKHCPFVVGMDASGDEVQARPEAFAVAYRFLKGQKIETLTYHAGEDFYDLLDGLRAIDELLLFLDYGERNRIGHALSLGLDAGHFYETKHMTILAPSQYVLDNIVWLLKRGQTCYGAVIDVAVEEDLLSHCHTLYSSIYDDQDFNLDEYWDAYLLRANDPTLNANDAEPTSYNFYAYSANPIIPTKASEKSQRLYRLYLEDTDVRKRGDIPYPLKYNDWIIGVVKAIQQNMMSQLQEKGIMIESAPTSNLYIGQFDRYDEHPILQMSKIVGGDTDLSVSINTDDSGILATSLYAEYSLIALSLLKSKNNKYTDQQVLEYIDRLRENSNNQRFKLQ